MLFGVLDAAVGLFLSNALVANQLEAPIARLARAVKQIVCVAILTDFSASSFVVEVSPDHAP